MKRCASRRRGRRHRRRRGERRRRGGNTRTRRKRRRGTPDAVEHGGGELPPEPRLVRQGDVAQRVIRLAGEALRLQGVRW